MKIFDDKQKPVRYEIQCAEILDFKTFIELNVPPRPSSFMEIVHVFRKGLYS